MADALEAEAEIIGAIERFQKPAKQMRSGAKKIADYGIIPDNGGHSMSQVQDGIKNLRDTIWELTPLVPEES